MDRVGVGAGETLMIGDTTHDLELARNAGAAALAVAYGAHRADELAAVRAARDAAFDRASSARGSRANGLERRRYDLAIEHALRDAAFAIASWRLSTPSLLTMLAKWKSTVRSAMPSLTPMSALRHAVRRQLQALPFARAQRRALESRRDVPSR